MNDTAPAAARRGVTDPAPRSRALFGEARSPARARSVERAAQLLDVVNDTELEHFVRSLVSETTKGAVGSLPPGTEDALTDVLTRTARRTLPTLRGGTGAERTTAARAARAFGLELEGMSPDDRDFEIARHLVRYAEAAVLRTIGAPARGSRAATVAAGVTRAGQEFAPGLLAPGPAVAPAPGARPWPGRGGGDEVIRVQSLRR